MGCTAHSCCASLTSRTENSSAGDLPGDFRKRSNSMSLSARRLLFVWCRRRSVGSPKLGSLCWNPHFHTVPARQFCSSSGTNRPLLTLFTKDNCQLCDIALAAIESSVPSSRYELEKVDITLPENKAWFTKYRYDIPVFHLNGAFLMKHKADCSLLSKELDRLSTLD